LKFFIGVLALWVTCLAMALADAPDSLNTGDRPFIDSEPIDVNLLQSQVNIALGTALQDMEMELTYDERIARAAVEMLQHPEFEDSTDADGFLIPFDRILVEKEGYPCTFVYEANVSSKTVCPTVRNFDDSDTYAAIAERYVNQIESTLEFIQPSGFKGYGAGLILTEEYPQMADGRILTDEPKDQWIHVLFFFTIKKGD
jgi:hypothetical protein